MKHTRRTLFGMIAACFAPKPTLLDVVNPGFNPAWNGTVAPFDVYVYSFTKDGIFKYSGLDGGTRISGPLIYAKNESGREVRAGEPVFWGPNV